MSLLCQLWSLNEAIQALKDQQQLIQEKSQIQQQLENNMICQNRNSVSPVMEDSEDLLNDSPDNSQDWEIEDSEMIGKQ